MPLKDGWIRTSEGHQLAVDEGTIDILDVAHALSHVCRFGGHTPTEVFYTVAQHSCLVADYLPTKELALCGLLHDLGEYALGDFCKPFKNQVPQYEELEHVLMLRAAKQFNFEWPIPSQVKEVDNRLLRTEQRDIMKQEEVNIADQDLPLSEHPYSKRITEVWSPVRAELEFLKRYIRLTR